LQQDGSLCAQHCLNSLLQGPYFNAVDLSVLARQLDEAERAQMAKGDVQSKEYLTFLEVCSPFPKVCEHAVVVLLQLF
jgi:ataxin-3